MNHQKNMQIGHMAASIAQSQVKEQQKTASELVEAIGTSHDVLLRIQTAFPFTIFPTTLSIDRTKITITQRDFFKAGEVLSIRIEDVLNVTAHVNPILGSIKIVTRYFNPDKPYVVDKLKRADALRFKRILQGYLIARQQNIDCTKLPTTDLAKMLDDIGKVDPEEKV